jgi:hypothetical protein
MAMNLATHPLIWRLIMSPALRFFVAGGWDPIEALTNESPRDDHTLESDAYLMPDSVHTVLAMGQLEKLDEANLKRIRNGISSGTACRIRKSTFQRRASGENIFHSFVAKRHRQNFSSPFAAASSPHRQHACRNIFLVTQREAPTSHPKVVGAAAVLAQIT